MSSLLCFSPRSSYSCRYFVLPCCFFDFCGKYQRRQCKKSQYKEYIDFITDVSTVCGFHTEEDCLRIPSTKRVGWSSVCTAGALWLDCLRFTPIRSFSHCHNRSKKKPCIISYKHPPLCSKQNIHFYASALLKQYSEARMWKYAFH